MNEIHEKSNLVRVSARFKLARVRVIGSRLYFDNVMTKFVVNNRTDALKTVINLFLTITNCRIARSRALTRRMTFKFMCLSTY